MSGEGWGIEKVGIMGYETNPADGGKVGGMEDEEVRSIVADGEVRCIQTSDIKSLKSGEIER